MIPILFDSRDTTFTTNGIGRLSDAKSCVVTEERNGQYTLLMEYPLNGVHFKDIKHSNVICAKPSQGGSIQPFRICLVSRPINGVVKVSAEHISYQLNHIPVMPFSAQGVANALNGFKTNAAEACPFTFWTNLSSTSSFAIPYPAAIRSYLGGREGSIIDVYGGGAEYEWDGYTVKLHNARGADRGVVLRYGKNITDLTQEENIESTYTGICPYWTSTEGELVTLPEKVLHSANASNFPYQRTIPYDFSDVFDNAPTAAQLREYTQRFMTQNNIGIPNVSIDVKFINLADTEEYKNIMPLQSVNLCDTVTVQFENLGVNTKAKVSKTEWDVLNDRYKTITIGDRRSTLSTTIEDQMEKVDLAPTISQMQSGIDRATGVLGAGLRGHVVINRNAEGYANEILFLDTENLYTARNVLRINMNGIGFSSTGYRGPYYQSWTIDGHFALGGTNNSYGVFEILDSAGNALGRWDKDGLQLFNNAKQLLMRINHGGLYLYNTSGTVLAQLTASGLNVYEGSIQGGTIKIGQNFQVDRQGKMTASAATFSGDIKAGTIKIGSKFEVKNDGTMTATGANFSGDIKAGTIKIGQKFEVKSDGSMTATGAKFTGDITGSNITGSSFKTGDSDRTFEANGDHVKLGPFYAYKTEHGGKLFFATDDEKIGFGDNDGWLLWEGWNGEYPDDADDPNEVFQYFDFGIHNDDIFCYDVYCSHNAFWSSREDRYWSLGECIDDIYVQLAQLRAAVSSGGGDDE